MTPKEVAEQMVAEDGRTKEQFERNFHDKVKEMDTLKAEGEYVKLAVVGTQLLKDQIAHDYLQSITTGYGEGAPTHYDATVIMMEKRYFPAHFSSGLTVKS